MLELTLEGVTKKYGSKVAVNGISCTMNRGIYGLLGANGSGKTTLLRMICGILEATEGTVRYGGSAIGKLGADYRRVLGYLSFPRSGGRRSRPSPGGWSGGWESPRPF